MKKLNLAFALTLVFGFTMNAQLFFNTGYDPVTTTYRAYGMQDVAWFVAETPVGSVSTPPTSPSAYVRAVVQDASLIGWWDPIATSTFMDAAWITYPNTCPGQQPAYHGCLNDPTSKWGVDQWYKISFFLCCDPADFCVSFDMWTDNRVQEIYVNTTTNAGPGYWQNTKTLGGYSSPGVYVGYSAVTDSLSKQYCGAFQQGLNTMIVHVISYNPANMGDYAGLLLHARDISDCTGITYNLLDEDDDDEDRARKASTGGTKAAVTKKALSETQGIVLSQNIPNPYDESTVINYNIPATFNKAQIVFTAMDGRVIKTVNITAKGQGSVNVKSGELSTGVYSYALIIDGTTVEVKKMIKQ